MSITYDPDKWTSSLRAWEYEPVNKQSRAQVLVSLRDFRYFKEHPEAMEGRPGAMSAYFEEEEITGKPEMDAQSTTD